MASLKFSMTKDADSFFRDQATPVLLFLTDILIFEKNLKILIFKMSFQKYMMISKLTTHKKVSPKLDLDALGFRAQLTVLEPLVSKVSTFTFTFASLGERKQNDPKYRFVVRKKPSEMAVAPRISQCIALHWLYLAGWTLFGDTILMEGVKN